MPLKRSLNSLILSYLNNNMFRYYPACLLNKK